MSFPKTGFALLLLALAPRAEAGNEAGNLVGWVQDSQGLPVANAFVSIFSKGMRDGALVTVSDPAGRFALSSVPAGSYTLRASSLGHLPARARQITVLPNQDSFFAISLKALDSVTNGEASERVRELQWLERHKRRSVLEERDAESRQEASDEAPAEADLGMELAPWLSDVSGSVEVLADSSAVGGPAVPATPGVATLPTGSGVVHLKGRLGDTTRFSVGGLVAENGNRSWRMAGEFVIKPGGGHEIRTGVGYGTVVLGVPAAGAEPIEPSGVGAAFVEDRWSATRRVTMTAGLRHSYVGLVGDRNYLDPAGSVEVAATHTLRFSGRFMSRTLAPGGDLLTVSGLAVGPAIAYATIDQSLRPERTWRYEMEVEQSLGRGAVAARLFREDTRDQLVNVFSGSGADRSLRIVNDGAVAAQGVEFQAARRFGRVVTGTVTYSYGRLSRPEEALIPLGFGGPPLRGPDVAFHDVAGQLQAAFPGTDTRLVAACRFNTLMDPDPVSAARHATRFDIQLSQGLPFLGALTRADWDVLVAFRNLFYEGDEASTLDEIAVVNPPKRVLGGISVRF